MVHLCAMSYVLDRPFKYWASTLKNKMASIFPVFKWPGCQVFKWHLTIQIPNKFGIKIPTVFAQSSQPNVFFLFQARSF